jgi:hypothetical protein
MPKENQPLSGSPGRTDLDEQGYEDSGVRITVLSYTRVQEFYMIRDATGLQVEARIRRPGGFGGGAEIKVLVELRAPVLCPHTFTPLPTVLKFSCVQGTTPESQSISLQELGNRRAPFFVSADTESGRPWLRVSQTSSVAPSLLLVQPSAFALPPQAGPYRGTIRLEFPGATQPIVTIPVELTVSAAAGPLRPPNDRVVDALWLEGSEAQGQASTVGATMELGEPGTAFAFGTGSVWWKWRAPASGPVELSTTGSAMDTVLGVYVVDPDDRWQLIGENDNETPSTTSSAMRIEAIAGQTYWFMVGGRNAAEGNIQLGLRMPPLIQPGGRNLFPIQLLGIPGAMRYAVEASEDLIHWRVLSTLFSTESILNFSDPTPSSPAGRYYRLRTQ